MASAEMTRRLLLRYFKQAPVNEIETVLEVMYSALSVGQKQALRAQAKAFLLPRLQAEFIAASGTLASISSSYVSQTAELAVTASGAGVLVEEIETF